MTGQTPRAGLRDDPRPRESGRHAPALQSGRTRVGAQDVYLTGSPQITFFKTIYRRHTNFAIESIEQTFMC